MEPLTRTQSGVYLVAFFATWAASIGNFAVAISRHHAGQPIHAGPVILLVIGVFGGATLLILVCQVGLSDAGPSKRLASGRSAYLSRWAKRFRRRRYAVLAAWVDLFMRMYFGIFVRSALRNVVG